MAWAAHWDRNGQLAGGRPELRGRPVPRRGSWRSHCSVTHASAFLPNRRAPTSSFLQIGSGYGNWAQGSTVLTSLLYVSELRSDALQFDPQSGRSEEHTSELQSLMRISYAVFCLKKKTI